MSIRIKARAIKRAGLLAKEFKSKGGRPKDEETKDADVPSSQTEALKDAGFSEHQSKQAVRVANIPDAEFEAAVEAEDPPTITALHGKSAGARA